MSVVLVNGDGNPAVHASQDADLLGGIGGQETGILDINDKFAATIADANTVEISSGVCITKEGRRIQIDVGDVEEIVVPTGSQGTTKYYIIGFHLYTDGSGNQLAETFIDEVASPSATITEKMFKDGETEVYVSLYRITRNGLNLEGLTLILPEIGSLAGGGIIGNTDISGIADGTVTGAIAQINTDLSAIDTRQDLNTIGTLVDISTYTSSSPYTLPCDGYVLAASFVNPGYWQVGVIPADGDTSKNLSVVGVNSYPNMLFVKKGMKAYLHGHSGTGQAYFFPLE